MGVFFPKDEYGNYYLMEIDENKKFCVGMDEPDLKVILERKLREAKCNIINRTMATSLIVDKNKIIGAIGLNIAKGEVILCEAKSVILANGSAARFGLPNSGYLYGTFDFPGNAGDGFSLAFRAGAKLTGMEYTVKTPLVKDIGIPILNITLARGAKIVKYSGEEVFDKSNFSVQKLRDEFFQNSGPFYLKTDHLAKNKIVEIENVLFSTERPMQRRYWELKNIKLGRDLIELQPTEAQLCGGHGLSGIVIDQFAKTTVNGLFAAGDVSSVPMQFLTEAFVYGRIAAESAVEYNHFYNNDYSPKIMEDYFSLETKRLGSLSDQADNEINNTEFEHRVRRVVNDYLISPKNAKSLKNGLAIIQDLREKMPISLCVSDYHQLGKALEIQYILDCAQMSALASLTREESRWGSTHYRIDFPERNDEKWLKHIDIIKADKYPEMKAILRDVQGG